MKCIFEKRDYLEHTVFFYFSFNSSSCSATNATTTNFSTAVVFPVLFFNITILFILHHHLLLLQRDPANSIPLSLSLSNISFDDSCVYFVVAVFCMCVFVNGLLARLHCWFVRCECVPMCVCMPSPCMYCTQIFLLSAHRIYIAFYQTAHTFRSFISFFLSFSLSVSIMPSAYECVRIVKYGENLIAKLRCVLSASDESGLGCECEHRF